MSAITQVPVLINADPIPSVSIRPGEFLRYKNKILYVNSNDRIVMYGLCISAASSVLAVEWSISNALGLSVNMSDSTSFPLGTKSNDLVLLGNTGLLSEGDTVSTWVCCT